MNKLWKCKLLQSCIALGQWQRYVQAKQSNKYRLHCELQLVQTQENVMSPWARHNSYCYTLANVMIGIVLTNCCLKGLILWYKSPGKYVCDDYQISSQIKSCITLCQYMPDCLIQSSATTLHQDVIIRPAPQAPRFNLELRSKQITMRGPLFVGAYTSVIVGKLQNNWQA
jgi:hypothetical protein